jgi:hypothetical protein
MAIDTLTNMYESNRFYYTTSKLNQGIAEESWEDSLEK